MDSSFWTLANGITILLCLLGVIFSFLPFLPGCVLVWLAILLHKLWVIGSPISWSFVYWMAGLTLLAQVMDYACTYWGARRFGASWYGGLGALVGLIVFPLLLAPVLMPLIGFIIGPIVGAVIGELLGGRQFREASKAGLGTFVGGLVSFIIKVVIAISMTVAFIYQLYANS